MHYPFQRLDNPNVVFGYVEYEHDEEDCFKYMQIYGVLPIEEVLNQLYQTKDSWLVCKVFQGLDNPNVVFGYVEYEHDEEDCFEYMHMVSHLLRKRSINSIKRRIHGWHVKFFKH